MNFLDRLFRKNDPTKPYRQEPSGNVDLISLANTAAEVFLAHPQADQDTILSILKGRGIPPEQSWRLYQFVPIAFAHVVLGGAGVQFASDYISVHPNTKARTQRPLTDEPLYVAGVHVANQRIGTDIARDLRAVFKYNFAVFSHSAEYAVVNDLLQGGGKFSDIVCIEPILFEYTEERA